MAMDKKMRFGREIATESQELLNVLGFWSDHVGVGIDHIVKAQLQPLVLAERAKGRWDRPVRIEDGDHMANPRFAVPGQLVYTAHLNSEWRHPLPFLVTP